MFSNEADILLFHPYLPESAKDRARAQMDTRWLGQGPLVDEFEQQFQCRISHEYPAIAVNSGTSALHLAYILAGIKPGDLVIGPVFTCLHKLSSVLLEDGRRVAIHKLVSEKYTGRVASYNHATNKIEYKRVIGWHRNPLGSRRWIGLSYSHARNNRFGEGTVVWLTEDHPVLTKRGYIHAGELSSIDEVATNYLDFNTQQRQLVLGMMLGDGHVRVGRDERSTAARYNMAHVHTQAEWLNLKISLLDDFAHLCYQRNAYKQSKDIVGVTFQTSPVWRKERQRWYNNRKKILPVDLQSSEFNDLVLATWYMDDGNLHKNGAAILCTESFTKSENERLIEILQELDIKAVLQNQPRNGHIRYRLYIGNGNNGGHVPVNSNTNSFFRRIARFVPSSLRYKLPESIADTIPFDPNSWSIEDSEIFYGNPIIVRDAHPSASFEDDASVYCLDVEDNHNFVTNDIVVHNCSATFSGLLYQGAKPVFADIERNSLNIDPDHVEQLLRQYGERIKAIVVVHYAGFPAKLDRLHKIARQWNVPIIEDAAQAVGAQYKGKFIGEVSQFTTFSFQAIKTLTTADGGMLTISDPMLEETAKRLRWFGIDRKAKFEDRWKKDIWEIGYKYQLTDISAAMGLEGLNELPNIIAHAKELWQTYQTQLNHVPGIDILADIENGVEPSYWLATVKADRRDDLKTKLAEHHIESNEVHFRCDRYSVYGGRTYNCPNMDYLEDKYLVLPMHQLLTVDDVQRVCSVITQGW